MNEFYYYKRAVALVLAGGDSYDFKEVKKGYALLAGIPLSSVSLDDLVESIASYIRDCVPSTADENGIHMQGYWLNAYGEHPTLEMFYEILEI